VIEKATIMGLPFVSGLVCAHARYPAAVAGCYRPATESTVDVGLLIRNRYHRRP
jgi:hypothetical protein